MDDFYVHSGSIEKLAGGNADGDVYDTAKPVVGFLDDQTRVVINPDGDTVTSSATFYTALTNRSLFAPRSRLTVNGRVCTVLDVRVRDSGPLGLPDHVEVILN